MLFRVLLSLEVYGNGTVNNCIFENWNLDLYARFIFILSLLLETMFMKSFTVSWLGVLIDCVLIVFKKIILFSPVCPDSMDWSQFYPVHFAQKKKDANNDGEIGDKVNEKQVEFADIGCGYGGLLGQCYK